MMGNQIKICQLSNEMAYDIIEPFHIVKYLPNTDEQISVGEFLWGFEYSQNQGVNNENIP